MTEYRNPQNEPGADKRMLLALLAVFVVIGVMQYFMPKPQPQPQPEKTQSQPAQPAATAAPSAGAVQAPQPKVALVKEPIKSATAETEAVLENDKYRITFTNRGGVVKSWVLKNYKDNSGKPLDMVNQLTVPDVGYPLSFFTYDKELEKKVNSELYSGGGTGPTGSVTYEYSDGDVSVRKTFRPDKEYTLSIETEVMRNGQKMQAYPQWPSGLGDQALPASFASSKIDWQQGNTIERKAPSSGGFITSKKWIVGGQTIPGPLDWAAVADGYFAVAFMPDSPKDATLVTLNTSVDIARNPDKPTEAKDKPNVIGLAFGNAGGTTRGRIFVGPKALDLLEGAQSHAGGPDLRGIFDFGTFGFIARPLFLWLKWTQEHMIHNWGWAIAFLTLVITMALLPLRVSSMKSSLRMQRIQPQMKAIQEKYKRYSITDPRRAEMQKEMSALYKKEGVNPLGGCFPLLLQMPFLIAFYSMLNNAIELRQANWLWIHDLSSPDPWHILPIVIMISMFVTQKSAPQGGMDPAQQKMMNFMGPLMIGGLSWGVAAGLSIYWALSTVLSYGQQLVINRSELGQQVKKTIERRNTRKR